MKNIISIWMQPVYARMNMGDHKVWLMMLATFPVLTMGIAVMGSYGGNVSLTWLDLAKAALVGIGLVLCLMMFFWFFLLVYSVALQYSPANARLVPNLKRHSQWALALPVLLLSGVVAMLFSFRESGPSISVAWLMGVFFLLALVAMLRNRWVFIPLLALTQLPLLVHLPTFSFYEMTILSSPFVLIGVGLLVCFGVLHWTFAMRSDRHFAQRTRFASFQMAMQGNPQFARRSMLSIALGYRFLLNRQLRQEKYASALLPFTLGPQAHWSSSFIQIAGMAIAISAYFYFLILRDPSASKGDELLHLFLFFPLFAMMLFMHSFVMLNAVYQTRIEQGLVSLAPRSGSQAQQTRTLLGYLLRQYFLLWTCTLVVAMVSCIVLEPGRLMRDAIFLVCFSLLPFSVCLLKNHAKTKGPQDSLVVHTLMACVAIFGISLALLMKVPGIAAWALCALIAVLCALGLLWRWHALLAQATVFPAGRAV